VGVTVAVLTVVGVTGIVVFTLGLFFNVGSGDKVAVGTAAIRLHAARSMHNTRR
jgi:hypothetical protein